MKSSWSEWQRREESWCKETGLQKSSARPARVLPWLDKYTSPPGFDHTRIYYSPARKLHILITEPYHSTDEAVKSLDRLDKANGEGGYSRAFGKAGTGIWNPGNCLVLLICKCSASNTLYLRQCADAL